MTPGPHHHDEDHAEQGSPAQVEYSGGRVVRWLVLGGSALLGAALFPFDWEVYSAVRSVGERLGGDVRRELETLQQFGAVGSLVIVGAVIWLTDPGRRARLLDLGVAAVVTGLVVQAAKMIIGRPRPRLGDPEMLLWPFGRYPLPDADPPGVYHAWEVWEDISSDLWSMPSSHTSSAVVLAVFLGVVYPRLRPLAVILAVIVACSRVLLDAHYPSDVVIGAGIGFACAHAAVRGRWGVRMFGGRRQPAPA